MHSREWSALLPHGLGLALGPGWRQRDRARARGWRGSTSALPTNAGRGDTWQARVAGARGRAGKGEGIAPVPPAPKKPFLALIPPSPPNHLSFLARLGRTSARWAQPVRYPTLRHRPGHRLAGRWGWRSVGYVDRSSRRSRNRTLSMLYLPAGRLVPFHNARGTRSTRTQRPPIDLKTRSMAPVIPAGRPELAPTQCRLILQSSRKAGGGRNGALWAGARRPAGCCSDM